MHGENRLLIIFSYSLLNDQTCSSIIVLKEHVRVLRYDKTETNSIVLLYIAFKQHCFGHSLTFALGNHALCGKPIDLSLADTSL